MIEDLLYNYAIVYDATKERDSKATKHLYASVLADLTSALNYCIHLPRTGFDLFETEESIFFEGSVLLQHDIRIIPSKPTALDIVQLGKQTPTLYITEASCYEDACLVNQNYPSTLGCVNFEDLSNELLIYHWGTLKNQAVNEFSIPTQKHLNVETELFNGDELSLLPNIFLSNQLNDTKGLKEHLRESNYSFSARAQTIRILMAKFFYYNQLGHDLGGLSDEEINKWIHKLSNILGYEMVLTLPGGPNKRLTYGTHAKYINEDEEKLIDFFGIYSAIASRGVWLKGEKLSEELFIDLATLEQHFHYDKQNSFYIRRIMKRFGREIMKVMGSNDIETFIANSTKIIAFTDFPIGLAILPGYSDPLCCMVSISYRPITPLTMAFQHGLRRVDEHYINTSRPFKVLIIECLPIKDRIRNASNLGWMTLHHLLQNSDLTSVIYKECDSIDKLNSILMQTTEIDCLIISAHGMYGAEGIAGICVGDEFWMPLWTQNVPPIVILSACHVAPKGKGDYTISDAFLQAGAHAVLGTLIPVNVKENAELMYNFFEYILEVLKGKETCNDLAEVWKRVVLRNAAAEIMKSSKELYNWGMTQKINNRIIFEEYLERTKKMHIFPGHVHERIIEIIMQIAREVGKAEYFEEVLRSHGYVSESFFYIFSGFPEKIIMRKH
ncbi:CHAT domain-containing protein [Paenibacillus massiliensis]|uniref:CHAT domain-containing protein n=1 Tax=Paenibacillus massiliensis TaxID=225917 RepID=UPI0003FC6B34|nr:CHAT domain-containing protein [Paenibacillus massiliensis]